MFWGGKTCKCPNLRGSGGMLSGFSRICLHFQKFFSYAYGLIYGARFLQILHLRSIHVTTMSEQLVSEWVSEWCFTSFSTLDRLFRTARDHGNEAMCTFWHRMKHPSNIGSQAGNRTRDPEVSSPARYHWATPASILCVKTTSVTILWLYVNLAFSLG